VFTKWAVMAAITSQMDSPAPGPADAAAIGMLVIGLVNAGYVGVKVWTSWSATATATPVPTATPMPTTTAPPIATPTTTTTAPPIALPRRWPGQTCENTELDRLQKEKNKICNGGYAAICPNDPLKKKEFAKIPCSAILLSILQRKACLAARWVVQDKCFGGKPDDRHKKPIDETQGAIDNCEAFKLINCAKDHPMAGK